MVEKVEPIFDYSVADWEYLASFHGVGIMEYGGEADVMAIIFNDEGIRARIRYRFPTIGKFVIDKVYPSLEHALANLEEAFKKNSSFRFAQTFSILNPSKSGKDLFEAITSDPRIENTITGITPHVPPKPNQNP